jgi:hypothetical protein
MLGKAVLVLLLLSLVAALPYWRRGGSRGYIPAATVAILFAIVLLFELMGRI